MRTTKRTFISTALAGASALTIFTVRATQTADAQATAGVPPSITTPDKVETRIGTLDFKDGMPNKDTVAKIYDNLDFTHAFEAFVNTLQGVSIDAIRKGLLSVGVKDNEVIVFSELMDAKSLFLTANADTIHLVQINKKFHLTEIITNFAGFARS